MDRQVLLVAIVLLAELIIAAVAQLGSLTKFDQQIDHQNRCVPLLFTPEPYPLPNETDNP